MSETDSKFRGIPIVKSGAKYQTEAGFSAIKNGVKVRRDAEPVPRGDKPGWLRAKMPAGGAAPPAGASAQGQRPWHGGGSSV